jgi:hypothetical protein
VFSMSNALVESFLTVDPSQCTSWVLLTVDMCFVGSVSNAQYTLVESLLTMNICFLRSVFNVQCTSWIHSHFLRMFPMSNVLVGSVLTLYESIRKSTTNQYARTNSRLAITIMNYVIMVQIL